MDDRDLEARLRTHLHSRFDAAAVPSRLAAAVRQGMETTTEKVGFAFRPRAFQLGWAATFVVAVAVAGAFLLNGRLGPATPGATGTPSPSPAPTTAAAAERAFIVLPNGIATPSKADSDQAGIVLEARLRAFGIGNFTGAAGVGLAYYLPGDGPSDEDIRAVLSAAGVVEFVPLPPERYGDIDISTLVGKPRPQGLPALFGNEGIASVKRGASVQGLPVIDVTFTAAASALFADYTTNHLREYLAIVIDGRIALVPVINEPITSGQVSISGGGNAGPNPFRPDTTFDVAASILVGGQLPAAWRGASVPTLISREAAISAARSHGGDAAQEVDTTDLDALGDGPRWQAVWRIGFREGAVVTIDAVTGAWVSTGIS